jgi:hypothetical protein
MINNYNIYEKINMLLNKFDLDLKINIQNDDFFKELFDKFIKNKINLNNKKNINTENICLNINNSENIINKNNDGNMSTTIEKKYCLVKLLYKKLVVIFHPDKGGNQEIFIKIKDYYDMDLLIGLLSIYYNNNLVLPELTQKDNDKILNEIIKLYIYLLQNNIS